MIDDGYYVSPGVPLGITCNRDKFDPFSLESTLFLELSKAPFLGVFIVVDKTTWESERTLEWVIQSRNQKDLVSGACRPYYDRIGSYTRDLGWSPLMIFICRTHCS